MRFLGVSCKLCKKNSYNNKLLILIAEKAIFFYITCNYKANNNNQTYKTTKKDCLSYLSVSEKTLYYLCAISLSSLVSTFASAVIPATLQAMSL